MMKAVLIIHNESIDSDINAALEKLGIKYYSKFTNMLGKGAVSEPHLNTDVWPGLNVGTLIITENSDAAKLMDKIRELRQMLGSEGVKAFAWPIEDVT